MFQASGKFGDTLICGGQALQLKGELVSLCIEFRDERLSFLKFCRVSSILSGDGHDSNLLLGQLILQFFYCRIALSKLLLKFCRACQKSLYLWCLILADNLSLGNKFFAQFRCFLLGSLNFLFIGEKTLFKK